MSQSTQSRSGEYRKLWSHGNAPSVEQLFQLCEAMPTPKLTELLLLDQSMRWNAKQLEYSCTHLRNHFFARLNTVPMENGLQPTQVASEFGMQKPGNS